MPISLPIDQRRTLGEKVTALGLIAPTLLNWAVLAHARWIGTVEVMDSDGVAHTVMYYSLI